MEDINEEIIEEFEDYINCLFLFFILIFLILKFYFFVVMILFLDEEEEVDDSKYEGILMMNIKFWKFL